MVVKLELLVGVFIPAEIHRLKDDNGHLFKRIDRWQTIFGLRLYKYTLYKSEYYCTYTVCMYVAYLSTIQSNAFWISGFTCRKKVYKYKYTTYNKYIFSIIIIIHKKQLTNNKQIIFSHRKPQRPLQTQWGVRHLGTVNISKTFHLKAQETWSCQSKAIKPLPTVTLHRHNNTTHNEAHMSRVCVNGITDDYSQHKDPQTPDAPLVLILTPVTRPTFISTIPWCVTSHVTFHKHV